MNSGKPRTLFLRVGVMKVTVPADDERFKAGDVVTFTKVVVGPDGEERRFPYYEIDPITRLSTGRLKTFTVVRDGQE